jgi:hypothetical protein
VNLMAVALGLAMIGQGQRPQLKVVLCDQVGLDDRTLGITRAQTSRIFSRIGVDLVWFELQRGVKECRAPVMDNHLVVVIAREAPKGWASSEVLGMAPPGSNRAYVFYDLAKRFIETTGQSRRSEMGVLLGHGIAHELGHLLMPGMGHGDGLMQANWAFKQWQGAREGTLLFQPDHAAAIRRAASREISVSALAR